MSELLTKLSRRRKKRDRSKTHSAVITALITNCTKRPLDEINAYNSDGIKRRAVSATIGSENQDCSVVFIDNEHEIKPALTTTDNIRVKKKFIAKFETSLPNEILFEIFKYLSQSDLFYAFLNLNQRFDHVLQPFTHHIDCSKLSIKQFEHIRNHLSNVKSLTINNQYAIKQVFRIDLNLHRFPLLQRLCLIDPTIDELNLVFSKLKQISIHTLDIRIQRPSSSTTEVTYRSCLQHHLFGITQIKTLESISIEMHNNDYLQFITKTDLPTNYDHLKELNIPLRSFDSLLLLLEHVPNLQKLCVKLFADQTPLNVPLCGKPPINLIDFELHVTGNELNFDRFVLLMSSRIRAAKLERFAYFNRTTTDQNYFNGYRWEIFLENSFPRLKQLQFCFDMPVDDIQTRLNAILSSFSFLDEQLPIGHIIWRPHSNKTRLKLFTLPYAFDTLKLSTSNARLFNNVLYKKNFKSVQKLVLDATHGTINEISQQLIDLFKHYCLKTNTLQIQNIVIPTNDTYNIPLNLSKFHHLKHLIINECDGRLFPLIFTLAPYLTTLTVTGYLLFKYFLRIPSPTTSYLLRIQTLELNCMQIDRQNRLNRILNDLSTLFPYIKHLTIDVNPKLYVDIKIIKTMLDVFKELISLKIQRTNKYILDKTIQDDRQVRNYFEINSLRLHHSETYEIICKDSQFEIWL
ncbi:unnamed protein product [Adineta steineri]|uniref:F-box domain-containing protein n=2 Tax=Adineta steineri TaxID=433720 RepID=A0A818QXX9_9BILA|nr:unnamed protein product [Adineta steineri]